MKTKKRKSKTLTLFADRDNPAYSIAEGRLTKKQFTKAFRAEGWSGLDIGEFDIRYEFWRQNKRGWKKSSVNDLKAKLVTVTDW